MKTSHLSLISLWLFLFLSFRTFPKVVYALATRDSIAPSASAQQPVSDTKRRVQIEFFGLSLNSASDNTATPTLITLIPTPTRTPRPTATPVPTPPPADPGTIEALSVFGVLVAAVIILGIWLNRRKIF